MVDTRFYRRLGPMNVGELAQLTNAQLRPNPRRDYEISDVAAFGVAGAEHMSYLEGSAPDFTTGASRPGACFAQEQNASALGGNGVNVLVVERPQVAFAKAARALVQPISLGEQSEAISTDAHIDASAIVGPGVSVGPGAQIGPRVRLEPNAVIGPGVLLGADTRVGAGAVVMFTLTGEGCAIHAGAVVGDTGFGLAADAHGPVDAPHFGRVVLGDRVTIGANTTVDRGRFDDTRIDDDAKIDNLVQIAHNVQVGARAIIAGCCGIAGSAVIGADAALGGSVGVRDHVTIGPGAQIAAATVLMRDVPPGETWAGMPAKPIQMYFREVATLSRLAKTKTRSKGETSS